MEKVKGYTSNEKFICSSFFLDKKIIFYLLVRILGLINTFKKQILLGRSNVTIYIIFFTTIELANFSFYWFLFESPLTLFYHLTFQDLKIFNQLKFGAFFAWGPQAIASLAQYVELALVMVITNTVIGGFACKPGWSNDYPNLQKNFIYTLAKKNYTLN